MNPTTKSAGLTLAAYFESQYLLFRSLTDGAADCVRRSLSSLDAWHGSPVQLGEMSDQVLALYIQHAEANRTLAPRTIRNRRNDVLQVWRHAHSRGECAAGPRFTRPVRVPRKNPVAWSAAELAALFETASGIPGCFGNGIRRSLYFWTLFRTAYETGLRRADLMALDITTIREDGVFCIVQQKTGLPHACQVRPETLQALQRIALILHTQHDSQPERPLRWTHNRRGLTWWLHKITKLAGIRDGCLQQLRRSGASHLEAISPGSATRFLAHSSPTLAARHYVDATICGKCLLPPEPHREQPPQTSEPTNAGFRIVCAG